MKVPFLDLQAGYLELKDDIDSEVSRVLNSGVYIGGHEVLAFENEWAHYCGASHSVAVGNGLDALRLALLSLNIGVGDEVIVPAHTFIATWLAVTSVGATPVPVEPNILSFNIDYSLISASITSATKAIIPVHLYGQPCDLDPILDLAKHYSLFVIEDAAQAHGSRYKGRRIGTHGIVTCWSFYPGKNLGAFGDAGAITTNNHDLALKIRTLSNYGSAAKYVNTLIGFNSRLDPLQAAILRVKLRYLDEWNSRRKLIADYYSSCLKEANLILPYVPDYADPVWHIYNILHENRDSLKKSLEISGVSCGCHYPVPPHRQLCYEEMFISESFPITQHISDRALSIPIGPHMNKFMDDVCEQILINA